MDDEERLELLLMETANSAPRILGALLQRTKPSAACYPRFLNKYLQVVVMQACVWCVCSDCF